jgi:RNA polymerase sigma factor (sigma-70 family)
LVAVPSIGRAGQPLPQSAAPGADATRRLYEQYGRQILAYCQHQLGNREEAEDATQSTFLNAFRGLQRGVHPEFELAWLYKIAQNVCLTRLRSTSRRRRVEGFDDLDALQDVVPAREVDSDELIGLPQALEEMPKQQQRALLLREWQGLSYREIAAEMDISQAAVETLIFRARRTLAAGLTEEPNRLGKRAAKRGDTGSFVALLKSLLWTGGAKVAATVATVAATTVVAGTPITRHAVENAVMGFTSADTHRVAVHDASAVSSAPKAAAGRLRLLAPSGARIAGAQSGQQTQTRKQGKVKRHAGVRQQALTTADNDSVSGSSHSKLAVPGGDTTSAPTTATTLPAATPAATPAASAPAAATPTPAPTPAAPAASSPPAAAPAATPATPADAPTTTTSTSSSGSNGSGSSGSGSTSTTNTTSTSGGSSSSSTSSGTGTTTTTSSGSSSGNTSGGSGGTSSGSGTGSGPTQSTPTQTTPSPPVATQPVQPIAPVTQTPTPTTTTPSAPPTTKTSSPPTTTTSSPPTTTTSSPPLRPTPPVVRKP